MSDRYNKIDKGICPECGREMVWNDNPKYRIGHSCTFCGISYRFIDDMGPGTYSGLLKVGGRKWKEQNLNELLEKVREIGEHYHEYDNRIELITENVIELIKEVEINKEQDSE